MDGFNPERLREIRIARKMTLAQLATNIGVTKQAVSKYECGKSIPSTETINKIITVLNVPIQFLTKTAIKTVESNTLLFFRTNSSTTKTQMDFADIISKWGYEILDGISTLESINEVNLPDFDTSLSISEKAKTLRSFWGIDNLPIDNMISLLENNGIFVFVINSSGINTDAYSRIINNIPVVIVNGDKGTSARQRFSLAHELGHLVLHRNLTDADFELRAKEIEKEASLFASNFLMPPDKFSASVIAPKLEHFLELKKEWKVSISAMIYHCKQIKILDDKKADALQMQLSKKWGRKTEPLDSEIIFEKPLYLQEKIHNLVIDKHSFERFFDATRLPIDETEQLCCLQRGYFSAYLGDIKFDEGKTEYEQLSLFPNGGIV